MRSQDLLLRVRVRRLEGADHDTVSFYLDDFDTHAGFDHLAPRQHVHALSFKISNATTTERIGSIAIQPV